MIVKVCGMIDPPQIEMLRGITDLTGFIFYSKSPRFNPAPVASNEILKVGVYVNEDRNKILVDIHKFGLQYIQLHGNESPNDCAYFQSHCLVIKAIGIDTEFNFDQLEKYRNVVDYFLFDTKCKNSGGSGQAFDWTVLEQYKLVIPFFLSGGINPKSLKSLQEFDHPLWAGIDLNSGFEIEPGNKNIKQLQKFIHEFRKSKIYAT